MSPCPASERRRATARAEKVVAQAAELAMAAVQAAALSSPNPDAAAQASVSTPASPDASVQLALLPPPIPAAQVGDEGHAGHRSVLVPVAAVLHAPLLPGESIPQLDGSPMPTTSNFPSQTQPITLLELTEIMETQRKDRSKERAEELEDRKKDRAHELEEFKLKLGLPPD